MTSTNIQLIGIVLLAIFSSKLVESIDSIYINLDIEKPENATYGGENSVSPENLSNYHKRMFHLENGGSGWNIRSDALKQADDLYPAVNDDSSASRSALSNIKSRVKSIRIVNKTTTNIGLATVNCTVIRRIKCKFNSMPIGEQSAHHTGLPVFVYGDNGIKYDLFPSVSLHISPVKTDINEVPFRSNTDYAEIDEGRYRVQRDYSKADMKPVTMQTMYKSRKSGKKVSGKLFARQTVGYVEITYISKAVFTVVKTTDFDAYYKNEILTEIQVPEEVISVETLFLNITRPSIVKIYDPETN